MAEISLQERHNLAMALLHVWPGQHPLLRKTLVDSKIGFVLPDKTGIAAVGAVCTAFWIGPNSYFLAGDDADLIDKLHDAIDSEIAVMSDLSHARIVMRLAGSAARRVLAKGLPVDLHPRVFPAHSAAVSAIHGFDVLVHLAGQPDDNIFDLYASRSYGVDFRHWLSDAGLEFGL